MSNKNNSKSSKSPWSLPRHETLSRRPRSSFEDVSITTDRKINTLLSEKHFRADSNALNQTTPIPNPIHAYARSQPYYHDQSSHECKSNCKSMICHQLPNLESNFRNVFVANSNHVHNTTTPQFGSVQQRTDSNLVYSAPIGDSIRFYNGFIGPVSGFGPLDSAINRIQSANARLLASCARAAPSAPDGNMFANLPKFDLSMPDSARSNDSIDITMGSTATAVGPTHNSHTSAFTQPIATINSINSSLGTNRLSRSYRSVAATPPSKHSVSQSNVFVSKRNVCTPAANISLPSKTLKKSEIEKKKSASQKAPTRTRPPLASFILDSAASASPDSTIIDSESEDDDILMIGIKSKQQEYCRNSGSLHRDFSYNMVGIEVPECVFLVPIVVQILYDLVCADKVYRPEKYQAFEDAVLPCIRSCVPALNCTDAQDLGSVGLDVCDADHNSIDAELLERYPPYKAVSSNELNTRNLNDLDGENTFEKLEELQYSDLKQNDDVLGTDHTRGADTEPYIDPDVELANSKAAVVSDVMDGCRASVPVPVVNGHSVDLPRVAEIVAKPVHELTVEEDHILFQSQEEDQPYQVVPDLEDFDDASEANINKYGDLILPPKLFIADLVNSNYIEDFHCMNAPECKNVMTENEISVLKRQCYFPFVSGCWCPNCSDNNRWSFMYHCYSEQCVLTYDSVPELSWHFIWQHCDLQHQFIFDNLHISECSSDGCHALVPANRSKCFTHSSDIGEAGKYQCQNCNKCVDLSDEIYWNVFDFKKFVLRYYCADCSKFTLLSVLRCVGYNCNKTWKGRCAIKYWLSHMKKKHSDDPDILRLIQMHMCMAPDCLNLVDNDVLYCVNHVDSSSRRRSTLQRPVGPHDEHSNANNINFNDGSSINLDELFAFCDYDQHSVRSETLKAEVTRVLVDALHDMASDVSDEDLRFEHEKWGVLKMKLIPFLFTFKVYRSSDRAPERKLRMDLYKKGRYRQLLDHCLHYQNKLNDRAHRRLERKQHLLQTTAKKASNSLLQQTVPKSFENQAPASQQQQDDRMEIDCIVSTDSKSDESQLQTLPSDGRLDKNLAHKLYSCKKTHAIDPIITNYAKLRADPSELTYYDWEDSNDAVDRINRSVNHAQRGDWKKSLNSLGDSRLVDIRRNNNFEKAKSKFSVSDPAGTYHQLFKDWNIKRSTVVQIFKKINPKSSSGKSGINNKLLLWIINNDAQFNFIDTFILFLKKIIRIGLPSVVCRLLMHSTLILLGKPKDGVPDHDVRPIGITDAVIRLCDKVVEATLDDLVRTRLVGPYQIIGKQRALEKSAAMQRVLVKMQEKLDDIVTVNIDASNAYNSMSRQYVWDIIKDEDKMLANWVHFLYHDPIRLDLDYDLYIMMPDGWIQGFATSKDLYNTGKWRVTNLTIADCMRIMPDFKLLYQLEYVDDTNSVMNYKHLDTYIERAVVRYAEAGIKVNKSKSLLALNTKNETIINAVQRVVDKYGLKVTYDNSYVFLGVPYGTEKFINDFMSDRIDKLHKVYHHVLYIKSNFIRWNLLLKLLEFCKFRYCIGLVRKVGNWLACLQKLSDLVLHEFRMGMQVRDIMIPQFRMSQKAGGLGLRCPILFYPAAEISSFRNVRDAADKHFPFLPYSYNAELATNSERYSTAAVSVRDLCPFDHDSDSMPLINSLDDAWTYMGQELQLSIDAFNGVVGPKYRYEPLVHTTHKKLLQLMDKKFMDEILARADWKDVARIKCLSNNGALSWLNVPYNMNWSVEFNNQYFYLLLCLVLGAPVAADDYFCRGCQNVADKFGHHALSCSGADGKQLFKRHDSLCNYLAKWLRQAHYKIEMEARYLCKDGVWNRRLQRPGDIKIVDFFVQADEPKDLYLDISVGNIFAPSHLQVAQRRIGLAKQLEEMKARKYNHRADIKGLGYEVLGGMSPNFKLILNEIGTQLENNSCVPREQWIHRLRAQLNARLMLCNVRMLLDSGIATIVEPVCFDLEEFD